MRVMVCGKGGTGKTALTVLMGRILSENLKVYIVDSDESNILLPAFLGASPPKPLVEFVGGKREEEEFERMEPDIAKALSMAKEGVRLDLLPPEYVSFSPEGIGLLTIGKVREYGEGCACPFNILTRILLGNLVLREGEIVLVDTDAGVEHVGRRVEDACDSMLAVVDPTLESLEAAALLRDIASTLGKRFWVVANKVTEETEKPLMEEAARLNLKIDGAVRFDERLQISCLKREPLKADTAMADLRRIMRNLNLT
ncbi:MAG: Cobyrinic acid a, c-diamide synthase 1 [Candidatus Bathyarchaeota archaeon B26-1]|nr:MAG: Cobyrinic acid a, c-diamide synthase 1 [Candidatus Bathyarchaeota archaeon B26-1]